MKLIVIDPFVARRAPSMRSWIEALPAFRDLFEEIEIWATECDVPEGNGVVWKRLKKRVPVTTFHMVDFQWRVTRMLHDRGAEPDTLLMTTGCNVPHADIHYIHYWNRAMLDEQRKRPGLFQLQLHHRIVAGIVANTERSVVATDITDRWWWVVSRSIAERIRQEGASGKFRILPNPYDPLRFNSAVKMQWREEMRKLYQFSETELIFAFSSFGHFERKGLLQGIEALSILRERGFPVRLLVLGGTPQTVDRFRKKLRSKAFSSDFCIFTGLVSPIEKNLAAADSLIFPSHFEAFSLAEIEAAALGLRLYVTPHYGSEMILREPSNGRMLPWDPVGMADVIEDDIEKGRMGVPHSEIGEALTTEAFAARVRELFEEVIAAKKDAARL